MSAATAEKKVYKKILPNGLTVLVRPNHIIPKVSIQLWYNVGSKDEKRGERGIAHLIEHMIFKGTKKLSESDINMITNKLSGSCNAFTAHDYTGYLFDFPSQHWQEALPIMADCMTNCTFKEELLASEMKAVIQELKMYKDSYASSLIEELMSTIFVEHPYHYPIIGFKQDLWSLRRDALINFYQTHYVPNNATLVVVGDVDPQEVFTLAEQYFGAIKPNPDYEKTEFYMSPDLIRKNVTLYRQVQQPILLLSWVVPGAKQRQDYALDVLSWLLGSGKGSRLYKRLVDEESLATDIESFCYDLFDYSLFFIYVEPKEVTEIDAIIDAVTQEIESLKQNITDDELKRAMHQAEAQYISVLENNQKQAYVIGQSYLATGDEQFLFNYLERDEQKVRKAVHDILQHYFRASLLHKGMVLPLPEQDKDYWQFVQKRSDQEDERVLSQVTRTAPVEKGEHVHTVQRVQPNVFAFPRPEKRNLSNGMKVLTYHNANVPMIELILSLPAKHYYDPENLQGLSMFMSNVMVEGTKQYTAAELAQAFESRGMSITLVPGQITLSMLKNDFEMGLNLLLEILTNATFQERGIEKVRSQMLADLKQYWDNPASFISQLARDQVYKDHPYSKKVFGDYDSLSKIKRDDLLSAYKKFMTPRKAILAIVGDIKGYDVDAILAKTLETWQGPEVEPIDFPTLTPLKQHVMTYPINRDQVVLGYVGLSVSRFDERFDKLLLFDQIFTGGVLGSMSSRLFALREQSGLFYTVSGSLLAHTDEQPGMAFIKTIVSLDRLYEAEKALEQTINTAASHIEDYELQEAKDALAHSFVDNFGSNRNIATTFIFLERFNLPDDYFDNRARQIAEISSSSIMQAAQTILETNKMVKIKIGRM